MVVVVVVEVVVVIVVVVVAVAVAAEADRSGRDGVEFCQAKEFINSNLWTLEGTYSRPTAFFVKLHI